MSSAALAAPLADHNLSIFQLSTYEADLALVQENTLPKAIDVLRPHFRINARGYKPPRESESTMAQKTSAPLDLSHGKVSRLPTSTSKHPTVVLPPTTTTVSNQPPSFNSMSSLSINTINPTTTSIPPPVPSPLPSDRQSSLPSYPLPSPGGDSSSSNLPQRHSFDLLPYTLIVASFQKHMIVNVTHPLLKIIFYSDILQESSMTTMSGATTPLASQLSLSSPGSGSMSALYPLPSTGITSRTSNYGSGLVSTTSTTSLSNSATAITPASLTSVSGTLSTSRGSLSVQTTSLAPMSYSQSGLSSRTLPTSGSDQYSIQSARSPHRFFSISYAGMTCSLFIEQADAALFPEDSLNIYGTAWQLMRVHVAPLGFEQAGIVRDFTAPLGHNDISIYYMSTFLTDYLIVAEDDLPSAMRVLEQAGIQLSDQLPTMTRAVLPGSLTDNNNSSDNNNNNNNKVSTSQTALEVAAVFPTQKNGQLSTANHPQMTGKPVSLHPSASYEILFPLSFTSSSMTK